MKIYIYDIFPMCGMSPSDSVHLAFTPQVISKYIPAHKNWSGCCCYSLVSQYNFNPFNILPSKLQDNVLDDPWKMPAGNMGW